jgi:glycosyltransferase involved in cell wall biosynthesis
MLVTHFTPIVPGKSGMYESTKDQIKYERREGLDSELIDSIVPKNYGVTDNWLTTVRWDKAYEADVWVVHANLPPPLMEYIKKEENRKKHILISIMHGPVENMILKEFAFMAKNIQEPAFTISHINSIWDYDACVVLNQHEYDVSELFDENDRLIYIPNSIDLERYQNGFKWEYQNRPAIISCDAPRIEKIPVHIIFSMPKVLKKIPSARLNVFALPIIDIEFFRNILCRSKKMHLLQDCIENFQMKSNSVLPFIAGADIGFNSNYSGIMSRVHMEMMLNGVPVVSYNGDYTKYHAKIFDLGSIAENIAQCWEDLNSTHLKLETINYAHENFDRAIHVKQYIKLYQGLKEGKNVKEIPL